MVLDKKDKSYREAVSRISKVNLRQNNMEVSEGYEVDHIFPVSYGELLNLPPHVIADINNLQIITKEENSKKSNKCDSIPLFIQQYMLGITKEELDRRNLLELKINEDQYEMEAASLWINLLKTNTYLLNHSYKNH